MHDTNIHSKRHYQLALKLYIKYMHTQKEVFAACASFKGGRTGAPLKRESLGVQRLFWVKKRGITNLPLRAAARFANEAQPVDIKVLLRLYLEQADRLYQGSIKDVLRMYQGSLKALL